MTVKDAISAVDALKYNTFSREQKLSWLSELDGSVSLLVLQQPEFSGYSTETDENTVLLIPEPFSGAYVHFLSAQMDYHNREFTGYNNAISLFRDVYDSFSAWQLRRSSPEGAPRRFRY